MKAVQMATIGGPDVLVYGDVPEPDLCTATQIKVRLAAAGVNPIDTKIRQRGLFYGAMPPAILGCDGAGTVVEIGAEVRRFAVGDRVWFCHGGLGREPGNYAELRVLEESQAEFAPTQVEAIHAAAGPLALITAWEALYDRGHLQEGQTVLVHAGAGGVGHLAIQLARLRGARVIATASTHDKAELARSLGADATIDYRTEDLVAAVNDWTQGRGVDLALDTVGGAVFRASIPAVAHYGTLVTLLDPGPDLDLGEARMRNLSLAFTLMLTPMLRDLPGPRQHQGEILRVCADWMDKGELRVVVGDSLPLAQAAEAHRRIGAGHTSGKIVLVP